MLSGYLVLCDDWQWHIYVPFACFAVGWSFAAWGKGGLQVHPHQWLYHCWTEVPCIVLLLVCGV